MAVLEDLSGFEFEELMVDVFRKLGYENVRQAARTADEGRDVVMEEVVDGERCGVVVECKHTGVVGRPVVQKLHSAVATHDFDGPKRGIAVTTGRFTAPAEEYVADLELRDDPYPIELIDGRDLREIADEIGLDLYNGRIEILCEETLRPYDPSTNVDAPVRAAFADVRNVAPVDVPDPTKRVTFQPMVCVVADVDATFRTSVGVVHRIDERTAWVLSADRGEPVVEEAAVASLVFENIDETVALDTDELCGPFDGVDEGRFDRTETEYQEWAVDRLRESHTTTVRYTGDNNVTYTKTCEPNRSDVSIRAIEPVYVPEVRQVTFLREYQFPFEYYAAGSERTVIDDGIRRCVHCDTERGQFTYCDNCGSISCSDHVETERVEDEPVCVGCAVTGRFALKTKYFYDEENREAFREEYAAMPIHEKAMENPALVVGLAIAVVVVGLALLGAIG